MRGKQIPGEARLPAGPQERVRIRQTLEGWCWELLSADRHVISSSDTFTFKAECEAQAVAQGLPVSGLSRKGKARSNTRKLDDELTWEMTRNTAGKWYWVVLRRDGTEALRSTRVFLTRSECTADAREKGVITA
jgi:hypothetical protein